ncbi:MAG: biopolymer transporter ExbD [Phycisphaerales bacterium]|jgi:biopolymer transport protein ExbD|nr:biopolymer transporter ExbD [Phycisphaerales bacterium]
MKRNAATTLNANMTPMIDVTFLLIVFFVVVSQIVDRDVIALDLPAPTDAMASVSETPQKLVINVVPFGEGEVEQILIGQKAILTSQEEQITTAVQESVARGTTEIHLRAAKKTKYEYIHRIIESIRDAGGTPQLHFVVETDQAT